MECLTARLLTRGDSIAIEQGRLIIIPASGQPVPDDWLAKHHDAIVLEIVRAIGVDVFRYVSYSTGRYGAHRSGGVRLQLVSITTGNEAVVFFNADLDRVKDTKGGKAGTPLPAGEFRVGKRSAFYKFWVSTGLVIPNRVGKFHKHMGTLQRVLLTGELADGRLNAQSLEPLNIEAGIVRAAILGDKEGTARGQGRDKEGTALRDKETQPPQSQQGLQPDQSTCTPSYENKLTSKEVHKGFDTHSLRPDTREVEKKPEDHSHDEFWALYRREKEREKEKQRRGTHQR